MPLPRLALKHTAVPQLSGKKPEFTAWIRDARYYAKGVGFLSAFVSDPPHYVPVRELDTKVRYLSEGGTTENVYTYMHSLGISYRRPYRARATRVSCTGAPRREKRGTPSSRGTALK